MKLFYKILIILGIAIIGLFLAHSRNNPEQPSTYLENSQDEPKNEPNNVSTASPEGNPDIEKQIKVDLGLQRLYLFENGQIKREFSISSGKLETPTPTGSFRIIYKQDMLYSKLTGCWLAFWAGFTMDGKYGFHETPICEGERIGENKMGIPDSAGCIRLKLGDSEEFYDWAEIETPVDIY
ncbi:L,D-transpeptidase [Patescibacteria group bacterium]|nr:L,D-transpeptidase [Patescibacteria group bacterium]